jgi:hypothetical protein
LGSAGKLADLIVVDGDPLAEINVLMNQRASRWSSGCSVKPQQCERYGLKSGTSLGQGA